MFKIEKFLSRTKKNFYATDRYLLRSIRASQIFTHQESVLDQRIQPIKNKLIRAKLTKVEEEDRKNIAHSKCLIPISIGNPSYDGEKMSAILSLIESSFEEALILVCDTLQARTRKIFNPNVSDDELLRVTRDEGEEWLSKYSGMISQMKISTIATTWETYTIHSNFNHYLKLIESAYEDDKGYRLSIDKNIDEFIARNPNIPISMKQAREYCKHYLFEECAVMFLYLEEGYHYELYLYSRGNALQATYEKFIQPRHPHLLKPMAIRFKTTYNLEDKTISGMNGCEHKRNSV